MSASVKETWFYEAKNPNQVAKPCQNKTRALLYTILHRSVTQHNLNDCYKLLRLLPKETSLDTYVLFRYLFIMIESVDTAMVNKNFVIYLESLLSKLDLVKPDIYIEYMAYFMKHNRVDDARELYSQRHRFMTLAFHRRLPFIDTNLKCYELLLNYIDWEKRVAQQEAKFDVSTQGWIVNALDCLKDVKSNYEYFIVCTMRVLLYYGFYKKAYLIVSIFQKNNPDNISAQLLLYKLLNRLTAISSEYELTDDHNQPIYMVCDRDESVCESFRSNALENLNNFPVGEANEVLDLNNYPVTSDKRSAIENLRRLDPRRDEILEFSFLEANYVQSIQDLMDSLEYVDQINDYARWKSLNELLSEVLSSDLNTISEVRQLWQSRYQRFWCSIDYETLIKRRRVRKLFKTVLDVLRTNFDASEDMLNIIEDDQLDKD